MRRDVQSIIVFSCREMEGPRSTVDVTGRRKSVVEPRVGKASQNVTLEVGSETKGASESGRPLACLHRAIYKSYKRKTRGDRVGAHTQNDMCQKAISPLGECARLSNQSTSIRDTKDATDKNRPPNMLMRHPRRRYRPLESPTANK